MESSADKKILIYNTHEELYKGVAESLFYFLEKEVYSKGFFTLALSGGSTPKNFYTYLAERFEKKLPWNQLILFLGDERCVPFDHECSNYGMIRSSLFSKIKIPRKNIFFIPVVDNKPEKAAEMYENNIMNFFAETNIDINENSFDIAFLGVGKDGHIASLYPGDPIVHDKVTIAAAVTPPEEYGDQPRITLTLPILNNSTNAFFIVTGAEKADIVSRILKGTDPEAAKLPAALVKPKEKIYWFLDKESAAKL